MMLLQKILKMVKNQSEGIKKQDEGTDIVKNKDLQINIRLSEKERRQIKKRMKEMGIQNMSAFMIKMAIDGYCVKLDLKDLKEMIYLLRMCSNNLNQYAKKANETGYIYQRDIVDLRVRLDRLWESSKEIADKLSEI